MTDAEFDRFEQTLRGYLKRGYTLGDDELVRVLVQETGIDRDSVETYLDEYRAYAQAIDQLAEEQGGKFHHDTAFERLQNETDLEEGQIRRLLRNFDFDKRGMTRRLSGELNAASFEGDVAALEQSPGPITGEQFHGLPILEDISHPLCPRVKEYYERTLRHTNATDVEVLCETLSDPDFSPLLLGEAGTGKDTLALYVCSQTNRPVIRVNFGSDVRYEDLVGMYVLDQDGNMKWRDGQLTAAVKYGWVFIADEINAAPPEATMPLHQVTEEGDKANLILRERGKIVEPHAQFRFIATMNPPRGGYGGTNKLNDAFKSRFYTIPLDYLDESREAELLEAKTREEGLSISREDIETLCTLAAELRESYKRRDVITPITTRELIKACKMAELMSVKEAASLVLVGHAKENDEELVHEVIESHF